MTLHAYLPQDRLRALARGDSLPDKASGSALFADISGFTQLTERLTRELGVRRGIEDLTQRINDVYDAMIDEVDRFGGSVVSFAGDAMTCWFDESLGSPAGRAAACALALQDALKGFSDLSLKIAVCTGKVRRFATGDPAIRLIDALAGATIARLSSAEQQARPGEIILDHITVKTLGLTNLQRRPLDSGDGFFILDSSSASRIHVGVDSAVATPSPQIDPSLLKPWIPSMVYERETTGRELLLTELRPTTALFIRFTGIDYDNDPQAWEKLNSIVSGTQKILDGQEGALLELTIGDKGSYLYASFGATRIHENDSHRAIRAALEIRNRFNSQGFAESIQIGISSGTMRVGAYGGRNRKSFSALGNGVNLAARLMTSAASGEILVSGSVQKAGADEYSFEARPPMTIKGRSEPVPVFAVLGSLQGHGVRLREPSYALPLIGRKDELQLIASKLDQVTGGRGQIIGITGEAGMGKSRLAAEGIRLARRSKFQGYSGSCQSDGIITPYLVWNPIWTAYFNLNPSMSLRKQIRALEGELEDCTPEHVDAMPLLGSVLGLALPENDFTQALAPADRKAQLETVLVKCLQYAAKEAAEDGSGLLLILEDLHWIDPVSFDLLVQVSRAIENLPILILLTYRPPETDILQNPFAPLKNMEHFAEIKLTELSASESEQAIRAKLAHLFPEHRGGVPSILIQRITDRAQGNPFYVEELLNYMNDRGIDPHDIDAFKKLELPASLHSLILSRIDHLTSSQQLALKVASIIGRIFRFEHLHRYYPSLGSAEQVKADLGVMERLDLTPLESPEPDLTYLFKHLITHEVGYESIAYATRAQLHGQYAAFLETTHPDQLEIMAPQLAHHYDKAGIREKARVYLFKSGEQAALNFANEEALAFFNRALDLTDGQNSRFRFDVLMKRERVYDLLGSRREQRQDLEELDQLAEGFDDSLRLHTQLALRRIKLEIDVGDYPAAIAGAQAAIRELDADPPTRGRSPDLYVDALWLEARAMFYAGQAVDAKPHLEKALDQARIHRYARGEYNALAQLGLWHWYNADYQSALGLLQQSLNLIRQAGDLRRELDMLINLGIVSKDMYRFEESLAYYEQAQRIAKKIGDRSGEASLLNNMGRVSLVSGDFVNAISCCKKASELALGVNDPLVRGLAMFNQSEAYWNLGQYQPARIAGEESLKLLRSVGYRLGEADALENLARIEFSLGERQHALELAGEALEIGREIAARRVEVSALIRIGWMRLEMAQIEPAEEVFNQADGMEDAHKERLLLLELRAGLARSALARGDSKSVEAATPLIQDLARDMLQEPPTDQSHILPLRFYLTCIQILQARDDPRTGRLIKRANTELQRRCEKISDASLRPAFLAIPEHQAISDYAANAAQS